MVADLPFATRNLGCSPEVALVWNRLPFEGWMADSIYAEIEKFGELMMKVWDSSLVFMENL